MVWGHRTHRDRRPSMDAAHFDSLKVAVLTAGLALVLALALGPAALAEKEARVSEVECGILLPGILPEGKVLSTTGLLTIEPSGTATLVCHAQLDPALAPVEAV